MQLDIRVKTSSEVGAATALMVGDWYLHSQSAHCDARVVKAYEQLQVETDCLFRLLCGDTSRRTVRVEFTRCVKPYESDQELIFAARTSGTLEITSAAIAGERLHPLLDCEFGGAFDRFRAVHDLIGHAWCGLHFDLGDECAAWSVQDRLHGDLARSALATELFGVNAARGILGEAPDLRALLLRPSVLRHMHQSSAMPRRSLLDRPQREAEDGIEAVSLLLTRTGARSRRAQIRCSK
jgi:hypothetical protein